MELTLVLLLLLLYFCNYTVIVLPTYRPIFIITRYPESCNTLSTISGTAVYDNIMVNEERPASVVRDKGGAKKKQDSHYLNS